MREKKGRETGEKRSPNWFLRLLGPSVKIILNPNLLKLLSLPSPTRNSQGGRRAKRALTCTKR
jgi:hypothetical protein